MAQLKKPTVKNPQLLAAIADFKERKTAEAEKAMIEELKKAKLIAPVLIEGLPEDVDLSDGQEHKATAKFMMLPTKDGKKFFPVFTDWLELLKWKNDPECKTIVLTFDQYCAITYQTNGESSGIVINPSELGFLITREKMAQIQGLPTPPPGAPSSSALNPRVAFSDIDQVSNDNPIAAIDAFRDDRVPAKERAMIEEITKAQFIAPVQMINIEDNENLEDGKKHQAQVKFLMIQNGEQKMFPLFTDRAELERWTSIPEHKTMILPLAQYGAMFQQKGDANGIVINPFKKDGALVMNKQQVLTITGRVNQGNIQLFELKENPTDMLDKMKDYMKDVPEIHAAYIVGMRVAEGKESFMLIIDCDSLEDEHKAFDPLAEIARDFTENVPCGIVTTQVEMAKKVIENRIPFYKKED
ncbi:MAG: enhanced serine sensitivity protein SseB [Ruminococcus sp.]|nr:enhanced serine sensitivity protein SseB [Ruminococcus sp.]